jgi:hypothetical protein
VDGTNELVVAAGHSVAVAGWRRIFDDVVQRISLRFVRSETRQTVGEPLSGPPECKNGWWLAEHTGHATPDRMQRLLRTVVCDDVGMGDDLRDLIVGRLGHPDAILVVDETGYLVLVATTPPSHRPPQPLQTPRPGHQPITHKCRCRTRP